LDTTSLVADATLVSVVDDDLEAALAAADDDVFALAVVDEDVDFEAALEVCILEETSLILDCSLVPNDRVDCFICLPPLEGLAALTAAGFFLTAFTFLSLSPGFLDTVGLIFLSAFFSPNLMVVVVEDFFTAAFFLGSPKAAGFLLELNTFQRFSSGWKLSVCTSVLSKLILIVHRMVEAVVTLVNALEITPGSHPSSSLHQYETLCPFRSVSTYSVILPPYR